MVLKKGRTWRKKSPKKEEKWRWNKVSLCLKEDEGIMRRVFTCGRTMKDPLSRDQPLGQ